VQITAHNGVAASAPGIKQIYRTIDKGRRRTRIRNTLENSTKASITNRRKEMKRILAIMVLASGLLAVFNGVAAATYPAPQLKSGSKAPATNPILDSWIVNNSATNPYFDDAEVYVQSVTQVTRGVCLNPYVEVRTHGIPDYYVNLSPYLIDMLNARPYAHTNRPDGSDPDFLDGYPDNAAINNPIEFGESIGYDPGVLDDPAHPDHRCDRGYWPPGPNCPGGS
jgi:hypothetical protein